MRGRLLHLLCYLAGLPVGERIGNGIIGLRANCTTIATTGKNTLMHSAVREDCWSQLFFAWIELICRNEQPLLSRLVKKDAAESVRLTSLCTRSAGYIDAMDTDKESYGDDISFQNNDGCATGEWMYTAAALCGRALFYVPLDSPDYIYEMDVRKVTISNVLLISIQRSICFRTILISLEGCALYVECSDDMSTRKWYSAIKDALSVPSTVLEDCRLTADNVPIDGFQVHAPANVDSSTLVDSVGSS
ncbi:hypothetical protein KIN20_026153 [Parelaphostrongylus tenuis]|uniref:PH domain-containing protein n=1 Tax=Parelaphostrongylus tenuis TaxID=148309 RepID=A0AAD5MWD6_PARTN|nr:hypothetical protein KIN20_026153 [Parelaphostrongylus tenuis]